MPSVLVVGEGAGCGTRRPVGVLLEPMAVPSAHDRSMSPEHRLTSDPIAEARRQWERRGWQEAAPGMAALTAIMRTQQIMLGEVESALRPFGISFSRYELLMLLLFSRTGMLPMSKLSARLQVHPASVTNSVDRLESDGLVRREEDPADRRGRLVTLTEDGRDLAGEATEQLNIVFSDLGIPPEDLAELSRILADYRRRVGDFGQD